MSKINMFDGPIPGEQYTSDTKNQSWHRPPEITDTDKGIEAVIKHLTTPQGAFGLLNSLQAGVTIVQATDMLITSGMSAGKWTPDHALLLAGPVAKIMQIMADDAEIEYAMGLDEDPIPTISYYKEKAKITMEQAEEAGMAAESQLDTIIPEDSEPIPEQPKSGFMGIDNTLPLPTEGEPM